MSFTVVRNSSRIHFNEVQVFLNFITQQEPNDPRDITPTEVKVMRGLFYVHLYSALEKSINKVVENTLILISSKNVKTNHFSLPFNSISLYDDLKSFKDCSYKNFTIKSVELFQILIDNQVSSINETCFTNNLQNIWIKTVEEIRSAFGMPKINTTPRMKATIDEIVDKRNAVAHGRETAVEVGERYRTDVLRTKLQEVQDFVNLMIDDFETYYNDHKFLKPTTRRYYNSSSTI